MKTIEDAIAYGLKQNLNYLELGRWLTSGPCRMTPAEATTVMDSYRRQYPNAGRKFLPASPKLPARSRKAKATPTVIVAAEGGELLTTPASRPSIINRSAVKAFALKVSKEKRAGKFERVSKEFLDSVEANLETRIREIAQEYSKQDKHKHGVDPDPESDWFINGRTLRCVEEKLNDAVKMIVLAKVHAHPSVGKTLK